jgi:hypothetical protein
MGLRDEWSRDAFFEDPVNEVPSDDDFEEVPLHAEMWQALFSDEIWDSWVVYTEFTYDNFLKRLATFFDFNELFTSPQRFYAAGDLTPTQTALWQQLLKIEFFKSNVQVENFSGWANIFLPYN